MSLETHPDASPGAAVAPLIARLADSPLDGPAIAAALAGPVDVTALRARAVFTEDRYARVLLHRGADFEMRLLCWLDRAARPRGG